MPVGLRQLRGTFKTGATQGLATENAEPDFDLVEPARRGGSEMKTNIRMLGELVVVFLARTVVRGFRSLLPLLVCT